MKKNKSYRSGIVSIVGRPNVGKSTLLNQIIGEKIAIVSKTPQTTRNRIRGIYHEDRGQIVFIDTPGIVLGKDQLDKMLKKSSVGTINDVDCIIHVVDARERIGEEEQEIVDKLKNAKCPIILALNKVDQKCRYMDAYIKMWEEVKGVPATEFNNLIIIPISGKAGTNIDKLIDVLFENLPEGPPLYPKDTLFDVPQRMFIADIIREKLLGLLKDELPHSIAVVVESFEINKKILHIKAVVLVERDSQKEIVIGKGGSVLKKVGTYAREDLEDMFENKVYLETQVKLRKKWRNDVSFLQDLGYDPAL